MSLPLQPFECALIAARAESKYPHVVGDTDDGEQWTHVADIYAKDALLLERRLGLGNVVWYGYIAKHNLFPLYVVAIRGTSPRELMEWIEDATFGFVQHPSGHGCVHEGFFRIFESMTCNGDSLTKAVGDIVRRDPGLPLILVTGHSLGSPLACYSALDLAAQFGARVSCAMFASPRPGDSAFGHYFDSQLSGRYELYDYTRDLVPRMPPSLPFGLGFQTLPNRTLLKPSDMKGRPAPDNALDSHHCMNYAALLGYEAAKKPGPGVEV